MASLDEIGRTYNWMDQFHRLRLGDTADISGAYYNGNYQKTLSEAQYDKHRWIWNNLCLEPGAKVLDVGCGWGPILDTLQKRGATCIGLTLSTAQAQSCQRLGLDARVQDWKDADPATVGPVDGIVSLGAFEHFCSIGEYLNGKQNEVYDAFFKFCHDALAPDRRLYLQTMTWGAEVPDPATFSLKAPHDSAERILARLTKFYPGSWLPSGLAQIVECAKPYFSLISANSGRLDYIQTLTEWGKASRRTMRRPKNWPAMLKVIKYLIQDRDFPVKLTSVYWGDQQQCFIRSIMDHQRIFFQRI